MSLPKVSASRRPAIGRIAAIVIAAVVALSCASTGAFKRGLKAERAAHQALEAYRLASNREFFQAPYPRLRETIESAISGWALE